MYSSDFEEKIKELQMQLAKLQDNQNQSELKTKTNEEIKIALSTALEELHVAVEELQEQNTELLFSRQELEHEQQKYQNLFELAPDGYIATDKNGVIQNANQATEKLLGVRSDRLINKPLVIFVEESSRQAFYSMLDNLNRKDKIDDFEIKLLPRHSKPFYSSISLAIEWDYAGKIERLLWSIRDISERLKSERKIHQQAKLLEVTTDAIIVVDLEDKVIFCNSSAEQLYGWQPAEILGQDLKELWGKKLLPQLEIAKDSLLETGEWQGELEKLSTSERELTIESRWTLVRDSQSKPQKIMIVDTDITEKKQLQKQLYRAQRLESVGTMASGIAHDLNNILNPILGSAQLLPATLVKPSKMSLELIEIIEKSAKRGAEIVTQVLAFSRAEVKQLMPLQTAEVICEIEQMIKETFPKTIDIEVNLPDCLKLVNGDSTLIHQAVLNLCINARDAMSNGGSLTLSAENRFVDQSYARQHLDAHVGEYVAITVADTGVGIPSNIIECIFDPFFTTKEIGQGTGLGLFTVMGIVKQHNGFVDVASDFGQGTQFQIFLPVIETENISTVEETSPASEGNKQLILVVDDEEDNLQMSEVLLELNGYKVITAKNGEEAIATYERHHAEIELVLMDMMMPRMDGFTAIEHLAKISPQVKVICLSGLANEYSSNSNPHIKNFIAKPITVENLLLAIEQVLQA
ncbi:PAS domain-containing sensor histidine kinase [Myxosarcina sp. GI1]|uniref:PAS domain-containing hybrid sensor histidine kinase/response regulator n=1 Tax=Myxosarcina sp. GI1 TaxID=1541065 RepID=UPI0005618D9E|nr:PAS domain-containing sensor histidine kinase [Myxosarcina sp. GI1]